MMKLDMSIFKRKVEVLGIDIGSSSVKGVHLNESKGAYQLLGIGLVPLPSDVIVDNTMMDSQAVVEAIKKLVASLGTKARNVACSISGNSVIIRKIVLPTMTREQLEEQIVWEAEQYIPFDINDVNIDFQILSPDSLDPTRMNVLLVASKKDIINDYIAVFGDAGLELSVVDVDSFAVQNSFETNHYASPEDVVALLNIGASVMNINVVKDKITLFSRDVQMGGNLYTEEIQKQLGLSSVEAENAKLHASDSDNYPVRAVIDKVNGTIIQEIRRSLDFYNSTANEERITRIFISGGGSKVYALISGIAEKIGLPVEPINPFANIRYDEKTFNPEFLKEAAPFMTVAVGLAMRRVGDK